MTPVMGKTFKHDLMTVGVFALHEGMDGPADASEQGLVLACHGWRFCRRPAGTQHDRIARHRGRPVIPLLPEPHTQVGGGKQNVPLLDHL